MDSWFFLLFPAGCICGVAGSEEAKNLAGQKFSAVIRIRIATPSFAKVSPARQGQSPQVRITVSSSTYASQYFIRMHNETLSVSVCVCNPDRSATRVHC